MSNYPLQRFEAQLQAEIAELWERLLLIKPRVLSLVNERKAWQGFEKAYNDYFFEMEQERSQLLRQRISLERQIQRQNRQAAVAQIHDMEQSAEPERLPETQKANVNAETVVNNQKTERQHVKVSWAEDEDKQEELVDKPKLNRSEANPYNNKRRVGQAFRILFFARSKAETDDPFYTERMQTIARLINDEELDEVDILTQMPFTERDMLLWQQALTKEMGYSHDESQWERLGRFRLWLFLLELGEVSESQKAEERSHQTNDALYQDFLTWQNSPYHEITLFFQTLEENKRQELASLTLELENLQRIANEQQG